jgi:hypothetical protein
MQSRKLIYFVAYGVLKFAPGAHPAPHFVDPGLGDVLDVLFPLHPEGQ